MKRTFVTLLRIALAALVASAAVWQGSWAWQSYVTPRKYLSASLGDVPGGLSLQKYDSVGWLDGSLSIWHFNVSSAGAAALQRRCVGAGNFTTLPIQPIPVVDPSRPAPAQTAPSAIEGCALRTDPPAERMLSPDFVLAGELLEMRIQAPQ